MKFPRPVVFPAALLCLLLVAALPVLADDWRPIDPKELALKTPVVDKDSDAEALFWEVRVDDSNPSELVLTHYVRIKVFTERGKESQSKVDLQYFSSSKIKDIAARVIKADGTITELKKDDIFERTIVKVSGVKVKAKSFALPGVEPNSIIEYRWREVHPDASANHLRLQFQRDIPVQTVTYYLKPFSGMRYQPFHMGEARFVKDKNDFYKLSMSNMPAFREETRMPPEDEVRSWVFLYFSEGEKTDPEKYWKDIGKKLFEVSKDDMKVNDDIKNAVPGIIGDATTPEEKLKRIYDFCRTKIKNINDDASGMTTEEKLKVKENKSPSDTLKRGIGAGSSIDMLFAALAKAAGFETRLALSGNRDDIFFDKTLANLYFLGSSFIAVRVGNDWQFFSPAEMYTPFGMLGWPEEGQEALVTDAKEPIWVKTEMAPPEKSGEKRTGKFTLAEDGTLEGDVRVEYSGHMDFEKKEANDDDSPTQREDTLRDSIKAQMSTAEVTNIKIENITDPIKPFTYTYHVRVPGYAQRTGKRLFLQPGFFKHGARPLFTASDRKLPVYFRYAWSESEDIEIVLPAGFTLDNADAPASVTPMMTQNIAAQNFKLAVTKDGHALIYHRDFFFGRGGLVLYSVANYPALKNLFDVFQRNDDHTITLKAAAN